MATKLTKKQKEALTDKIAGLIRSGPALRMTTDSSVNELNINQISGELNRIHYRAIGKDLPAVFSFEPKQLGSGDPSPDNIRPIVGYEIDGIGTVYGGELNIDTGVLTVTYGMLVMGALTWTSNWGATSDPTGVFYSQAISILNVNGNAMSVLYAFDKGASPNLMPDKSFTLFGSNRIYVKDIAYDSATAFKNSLTDATLVYELVTPETYTLTPQQMLQLLDQI